MSAPLSFCTSVTPTVASRPLCCFFFNDTATTEIYTLSLHDALPIYRLPAPARGISGDRGGRGTIGRSEEHTSELQSHSHLVCRLLLEKKKHADNIECKLQSLWRLMLATKERTPT